jgi:hypothetical protein
MIILRIPADTLCRNLGKVVVLPQMGDLSPAETVRAQTALIRV